MILSWDHDQDFKTLTCIVNEHLKYVTYNGGGKIIKTYNGENYTIADDVAWEAEKHWISDNFSDTVGVYSPMLNITEESWKIENPDWRGVAPIFGLSSDGLYLDKLARTSWTQEGHDMIDVYKDDLIWIEQDNEGEYWKREYCAEQNIHYNVQPCCVFPTNPGRTKLSKEDAEYIMGKTNEQE